MAACIERHGCSQTASAYYIANPDARQMVKNVDSRIRKTVGPEVMTVSGPLIFLASGTGNFKLTSYWSLQLSTKDSNLLVFRVNF